MNSTTASLDDKYRLDEGRVYMTGTQALVRLPLVQSRLDRKGGLNTAGFISGYRGSPLGGYDQALSQAKRFLDEAEVRFQPGVNEDLAATAVLGTQQINLFEDAKKAGVFSIWYGKGPGVDRSGDAFRHGNLAGSAPQGGVLLLAGDDHTCKSSTTSHQSEFALLDAMVPVLNPAGVGEIVDFGLYGFALSRYSGCWSALKLIAETVDSSASVDVASAAGRFVVPEFEMPRGGLGIRWPDTPQEQERRLHNLKIPAIGAFARANRVDRVVLGATRGARIGVVTTGKSYLDVRQALGLLGLADAHAADELGVAVYKVGLVWPLEPEGLKAFASGCQDLVIVEEKRPLLEGQVKDILYGLPADLRPRVTGKRDPSGRVVLPAHDDLTPTMIARAIGAALLAQSDHARIQASMETLEARESSTSGVPPEAGAGRDVLRTPYFCSGCPHNTSTRVPEGSRAMAGIGCSWMAQLMDRSTATYTHMGAEGANWIGQAPYVSTPHIFQNLGDGTYFHSGLLAIRAAVAARVNITYKILFNDAVAMTGGQPHDGQLTPARIANQVRAEGVERIVVVSDDPTKYSGEFLPPQGFPPGVTFHDRDELDHQQRLLREWQGVSVLIYDQTCAAEKRRRRKRGTMPDPDRRVVINELVCEACGDCSIKSNCLSVMPLDTEFGAKRRVDQSSCNKDFSCLKGFCPSFVTVEGGKLRRSKVADLSAFDALALPDPSSRFHGSNPVNILVTGVGGRAW
jgi:indolepyruvate ferredoxin oxidoreductase